MKKCLFFAIIMAFTLSCSHHVKQVNRAFYFWRSDDYSVRQEDGLLAKQLALQKIYVKFFEVKYSNMVGNIPFDKTDLSDFDDHNNMFHLRRIVPIVYLKNEVFLKSSKVELDTLAHNVNFLISKYLTEKFVNVKKVSEFQMDCDWTPKSRDNYFYFLRRLKKICGKRLGCTLRLYPYKYRKIMGIPPVDSAMLMCYNLLNPIENKDRNSILDTNELELYLRGQSRYPLHLDVALPVYSWMHIYQNNRFKDVFHPEDTSIVKLLKPIRPLWYESKYDTVIDDIYLRKGDIVKYERVSKAQISETIRLLKANVVFDDTITVSLFDLNAKRLKAYSHETLSGFYTDFTE